MCYASSCNPTCGKCRPRRIIEAPCPQCTTHCEVTREEYLNAFNIPHKQSILDRKLLEHGPVPMPTCRTCGASLEPALENAVTPLPCTRSHIVCGWPCGLHTEQAPSSTYSCPNAVPLAPFEGNEVPEDMRPWGI